MTRRGPCAPGAVCDLSIYSLQALRQACMNVYNTCGIEYVMCVRVCACVYVCVRVCVDVSCERARVAVCVCVLRVSGFARVL